MILSLYLILSFFPIAIVFFYLLRKNLLVGPPSGLTVLNISPKFSLFNRIVLRNNINIFLLFYLLPRPYISLSKISYIYL